MSGSYRFIITVAVGWLALAGASPPNQPEVDKQSSAKPDDAPTLTPDYSAYPDKFSERCYNAADHDSADLCAQWRSAIAAEKAANASHWGNWIGATSAVLSFLSIILVVLALKQTERSLKIAQRERATATRRALANRAETAAALTISEDGLRQARETSALQLRPYVYFKKVKMYDVDNELFIGCELFNYGQTPAQDVVIDWQYEVGGIGHQIPDERLIRSSSKGVIAPGGYSSVDHKLRIITAENIPLLRGGKLGLFLRCRFSYTWHAAFDERETVDRTMVCTGDHFDRGHFRNIDD